ncbi:MAG: response regulator, partial [Planctomycetota bacterium]
MQGAKILVLDDETGVLLAVSRLLSVELDAPVQTTSEPEEALRLLERGRHQVFITDYHMPGMNGVQVLQRARSIAPDAVRILLTGRAEMEHLAAAINSGKVFRYVAKPWDNAELVQVVREAIAYHEAAVRSRDELADSERERRSLVSAVSLVSDIQRSLLPEGDIKVHGALAACSYTPCEHATGDYVD